MNRQSLVHVLLGLALTAWLTRMAMADPPPGSVRIMTWNVEWFFDEHTGDNFSELAREQSAPSRAEWEWKRNGVADVIAQVRPTIVALQEVENRRVLYYLTTRLKEHHNLNYRIAYIEGGDYFTEQDVAILYASGLVSYERREQSREMFESNQFYNVQKHLFATFQWGQGSNTETLTLVNVHFRATADAAAIRRRQAQLIRHWIEPLLDQGANVLVIGDLNAEQLHGDEDPARTVGILGGWKHADETKRLIDLHAFLPADQRQTHLLPGRQFDRILVSRTLIDDDRTGKDLVLDSVANHRQLVVRGTGPDRDHFNVFYDIPVAERDLSDHYPIVAEFDFR